MWIIVISLVGFGLTWSQSRGDLSIVRLGFACQTWGNSIMGAGVDISVFLFVRAPGCATALQAGSVRVGPLGEGSSSGVSGIYRSANNPVGRASLRS